MSGYDQMVRRQKILADFGEFALRCEDIDEILTEACRLVSEALGTERAKVLEIQEDGESLLVRAGVGWAPGTVGQLRLPMKERSSETYSIQAGKPVITQDIGQEDRFEVPDFMRQAGVVALVNMPILLPGGKAYGLLQVDDTEPREFGDEDTEFLRTYTIILGPVIDRLLKVRELRAAEERFRLTVETALDYAIFLTDREDRITDWLPGAAAVFGWSAEKAVGQPATMLFTPEDRAAGQPEQEIETARAAGVAPNVRWHVRKDGSRVFIEGSVRTLKNEDGTLRGFLKIGRDATEEKASAERQAVMVAELQHRTRNLLAVVRSIASQTMASSGSVDVFRDAFSDRLDALSRVQGLLSRAEAEPITIGALLRMELDALGAEVGDHVRLDGPEVRLRSSVVQTLALAIHELATNARKYGALATGRGRLEVTWQVREEGDAGQRLVLEWVEQGVDRAREGLSPTTHGGYGRQLIEQALPYALSARTSYTLDDTGVRCTIDLPLVSGSTR